MIPDRRKPSVNHVQVTVIIEEGVREGEVSDA
jgi:hypothetical protein